MRCDKIQIEGLSVIVPTFNEADNIEDVLDRIENTIKMIKKREIIIVDDSSPDNTGEIAENIRKKYGNMRIINRTGERGLASSIIDGMKNSNYDIVCVMDADLQHPPEIILEMIEKIQEGWDVVSERLSLPGQRDIREFPGASPIPQRSRNASTRRC